VTVFLLIVTGLILWAGLLYFAPFGPCPRCHGTGRVWRGTKTRPRPVTCPSCKGVKRRQRPGSKTAHQLARRVRKYRERQRRERAATNTSFGE
jgi:hypothetical protein